MPAVNPLSDESQETIVEKSYRTALEAIAKGRPPGISAAEWGEWCTVWARDELNAAEVLRSGR